MKKEHLDVSDLWYLDIYGNPLMLSKTGFCLKLPQGPYYPSANSKSSGNNIISV